MLIDNKEFESKEKMIEYIIITRTFKGYTCPSTMAHNIPFVYSSVEELTVHMQTHSIHEIKSSSDLTVTWTHNEPELSPVEYLETVTKAIVKDGEIEVSGELIEEDYITKKNEVQKQIAENMTEPLNHLRDSLKEIGILPPNEFNTVFSSDHSAEYPYVKDIGKIPFICAYCKRNEHLKCAAKTCECNNIGHFDEETKAMVTAAVDGKDVENLISMKEYLNKEAITGVIHTCIDKDCNGNVKGEILNLLCEDH